MSSLLGAIDSNPHSSTIVSGAKHRISFRLKMSGPVYGKVEGAVYLLATSN